MLLLSSWHGTSLRRPDRDRHETGPVPVTVHPHVGEDGGGRRRAHVPRPRSDRAATRVRVPTARLDESEDLRAALDARAQAGRSGRRRRAGVVGATAALRTGVWGLETGAPEPLSRHTATAQS